jgi:large subunit ribosomal protein L22
MMEVQAISRNVRLSAQKGRPLARKVQGMTVANALKATRFSPLKAAAVLGKTIQSAMANAGHNHGLDVERLSVNLCVLDEGARMRRFWPSARGSVHPIARRLCHCKVVLTDGQTPPATQPESQES